MNAPIDVTTNPDGTVTKVEIPLEGKGNDDASNAALATLRGTLLPETLGQVDGVEYAVTGATAASQDYNAAQAKSLPLVFAFVLLFAFGLLLVTFRSIVIALKAIVAQPAVRRGRLRRARRGLPVGLGREPARLPRRTAESRTGCRCSCS